MAATAASAAATLAMATTPINVDTFTGLPTYPVDKPPCVHGEVCYMGILGNTAHFDAFGHPATHPHARLPPGVHPVARDVYPSPAPNDNLPPPNPKRVADAVAVGDGFGLINLDPLVADEKHVIDWVTKRVLDYTGADFTPGDGPHNHRYRKVYTVTAIANRKLANQFEQTRTQEVRARGLDDSVEWGWHTAKTRDASESIARINFISSDNSGGVSAQLRDPGAYGLAVYFATAFDYTTRYADKQHGRPATYPVILSQVVRGRCWYASNHITGCFLPKGYDSLMSPGGAELAIRSPSFVLPSFIIDVDWTGAATPQ